MKTLFAGMFAVLVGTGCAANSTAPASTQTSSGWLLLASPSTPDFPQGAQAIPLARWTQVKEFPSFEKCDAVEEETHNRLDRLVDCIASDDPRLKQD